ncbi:MAG TPA: hypothetical protein VF710_00040 [Longimicrobium sp.]|jgi:hypothetical protein
MTNTIQRLIRALALITSIIAAAPEGAHAQSGAANPIAIKHRNDCRLAAQVLTRGEPHTKRAWARDYISSCPEEGPPAIAREWRAVPADSAAVLQLMRASTAIRDVRIYERVREVVEDRSRADVIRVGAMHVLDSYVNPLHGGWFGSVPPEGGEVKVVHPETALVTHAPYANGPLPLVAPVREPVLQLLQRVSTARDVEPLTVWYAAAALALRIQEEIEWNR